MSIVWRVILWTDRVLMWAMALLALLVILRVFRPAGHAKERRDGSVYFGFNGIGYCFCGLFATAIPLVVRGLRWPIDGLRPEVLTWAFTGILITAALLDSPNTILLNSEGLQQVRWLLPNKRIRWTEIEEVNVEKKDGSVTIISGRGTKVVHGIMLADRSRFLLEIKKHCDHDLPGDFPGEPIGEVPSDRRGGL